MRIGYNYRIQLFYCNMSVMTIVPLLLLTLFSRRGIFTLPLTVGILTPLIYTLSLLFTLFYLNSVRHPCPRHPSKFKQTSLLQNLKQSLTFFYHSFLQATRLLDCSNLTNSTHGPKETYRDDVIIVHWSAT